MIKIALKHYIYDYCISLLFAGIEKNFKPINTKFKVGDYFSIIEFGGVHRCYGCIVTWISSMMLQFKCKTCDHLYENGTLFMSMDEVKHDIYFSEITRLEK